MKILSLSTSTNICSVAILENNSCIKELHTSDNKTHSINLMPLVSQILEETNLELSDINLIACDIGPRFIYRNTNRCCNSKSISSSK